MHSKSRCFCDMHCMTAEKLLMAVEMESLTHNLTHTHTLKQLKPLKNCAFKWAGNSKCGKCLCVINHAIRARAEHSSTLAKLTLIFSAEPDAAPRCCGVTGLDMAKLNSQRNFRTRTKRLTHKRFRFCEYQAHRRTWHSIRKWAHFCSWFCGWSFSC